MALHIGPPTIASHPASMASSPQACGSSSYMLLQGVGYLKTGGRNSWLKDLDGSSIPCMQNTSLLASWTVSHAKHGKAVGMKGVNIRHTSTTFGKVARANFPQQIEDDLSAASPEKTTKLVEEKPKQGKLHNSFKKYFFHTEGGGQVRAMVSKSEIGYRVIIKVYSEQNLNSNEGVYLHWGLFRSDSSNWVLLDPGKVPIGTTFVTGMTEAMRTPLKLGESGLLSLELEFNTDHVPFYISFVLYQLSYEGKEKWIRNTMQSNFCIPVGLGRGRPDPLGTSSGGDGYINFALYSKNAENVVLCLYDAESTEPLLEIELDRSINRTGDIWHIELGNLESFTRYGYRCKGNASWKKGNRFHPRRVLLDPYAKFLASFVPGQELQPSPATLLGSLVKDMTQFDWEDDLHPDIPLECLVAYRLHVMRFTADKSSGLEKSLRGTFEGVAHKVEHFKMLGVNAVILQPIFAFDKRRGSLHPLSFFAPMDWFGPANDSLSAIVSLKKMVKDMHKAGIEVILDVIYSHTAENNDEAPEMVSFRGIDNATYYILDQSGKVTGCEFGAANSFNCNHPVVQRMILDSLRYWVIEYHIDGFCFANAPGLIRGPHGQELSRPMLVEAISFDPILSRRKLIADSYSPFTGLYKTTLFPHWKRWCEWNSQYRDDVRRFLRGESGQLSSFATRLCGSGDIFADGRGPNFSLNFITSPYGLTLVDLVSYSAIEGADKEFSWNCEAEGPTLNQEVLHTRMKQVRNFLMCLFLSLGVPVLNMGDEYGHSKGGSATNVEDRKVFNWDALKMQFGLQTTQLISSLVAFRTRRKDLLQRNDFLGNVKWHGPQPEEPHWEDSESSFLAISFQPYKETESEAALGDLYVAFNSHQNVVLASLPELSEGMIWYRIADTSLPYPQNFLEHGVAIDVSEESSGVASGVSENSSSCFGTYEIQPFSSILLEARVAAL